MIEPHFDCRLCDDGYCINFYFPDEKGDTRRNTILEGSTEEEAETVCAALNELLPVIVKASKLYHDNACVLPKPVRVLVTDGSSDGHTGVVIEQKPKGWVRIKRDADGVEVDIFKDNYHILDRTSMPKPQ
jgi:hypothetical protein